MGRTQAELFAWSERVRAEAAATAEQARATRLSAQEIRSRRATLAATRAAPQPSRDLAVMVEEHVPVEKAAERALMLDMTAREIADRLGIPVEYVVRGARERAAYIGGPVEDTLSSWFRVLVA
jgi:hypothetical protein